MAVGSPRSTPMAAGTPRPTSQQAPVDSPTRSTRVARPRRAPKTARGGRRFVPGRPNPPRPTPVMLVLIVDGANPSSAAVPVGDSCCPGCTQSQEATAKPAFPRIGGGVRTTARLGPHRGIDQQPGRAQVQLASKVQPRPARGAEQRPGVGGDAIGHRCAAGIPPRDERSPTAEPWPRSPATRSAPPAPNCAPPT